LEYECLKYLLVAINNMAGYARIIPKGYELRYGLEDPKTKNLVYTSKDFGGVGDKIDRRPGKFIIGHFLVPVKN
jgi:hypothetical protein